MNNIYSVDTEKEITPIMVRDAIIICFNEAHCAQLGLESSDDVLTKQYCSQIVEKAFRESNGDFDKPTKASLLAVLPWLAEFSKSFRDQTTIQKHMGEIMKLIDLLHN